MIYHPIATTLLALAALSAPAHAQTPSPPAATSSEP